jgi:hypothetical protein
MPRHERSAAVVASLEGLRKNHDSTALLVLRRPKSLLACSLQ